MHSKLVSIIIDGGYTSFHKFTNVVERLIRRKGYRFFSCWVLPITILSDSFIEIKNAF